MLVVVVQTLAVVPSGHCHVMGEWLAKDGKAAAVAKVGWGFHIVTIEWSQRIRTVSPNSR